MRDPEFGWTREDRERRRLIRRRTGRATPGWRSPKARERAERKAARA